VVFFVELMAFRIGTNFAKSLAYDPHLGGHHHAVEHSTVARTEDAPAAAAVATPKAEHHSSASDEEDLSKSPVSKDLVQTPEDPDLEVGQALSAEAAASQILGVLILEFGVIFHSVIIGITLGTTNDFTTLFIVIIFHQMFEGLGLGARLAFLPLKPTSWIPYLGGIAYALVTPIGLAIGLGVRHTYNEESATASYITGTFDSVSAGILLYTGLVELLAHEFIFNERMRKAPLGFVLLSVGEMLTGAGLMALLARWA
jgi:solute carrier family 39 (zinc transporter), member 1/2/3